MRLASPFLYFIDRTYGTLIKIGSHLESLFLLYLRFTWGHQFFLIGQDKIRHISDTAKYFASLEISQSYFLAHIVGWTELLGGLFLILGFASRLWAGLLLAILFAALSTAHAPEISNFKFLTDPILLTKQPPYPFFITCLAVFIFGPGRISIHGWLKRWASKRPKY